MKLSDPIRSIIQERVREMRSWEPRLSDNDIFASACGVTLKYAEARGQESSPELRAAIMAAVRQEMRQTETNDAR